MEKNIADELKELDILIKKRLFSLEKKKNQKCIPSPLQVKIVLYLIKNKDKDIYQKDLEKNLHVSKVAISEVLNKMEKNKQIKRINNSNDGRYKKIICTDEVQKKYAEMQKTFNSLNKELVSNINEEDINTFLNVLNMMKDNLRKENKDV